MTSSGPALAIDVGGTSIKAELTDADGVVLDAARVPTPQGGEAALTAIGDLGARLLRDRTATAAGVAVPGLVDGAAGVATYSANIGWRDLPIAAPLAERWGLPVRLGHDVAAAARAELERGAGRGYRDLAFVVLGTGLAAVIVHDGRVVTGHRGEVAELGHVQVRPGRPCPCGGDGCLERVASASAIAAEYARRTGTAVDGARDVAARLDDDQTARAVWREAVDALADGLAVLSALVAPEVVVLGGGLAAAGQALLDPLQREVDARTRVVAAPRLLIGELGPRAGVVGAALLAGEAGSDR